MGNLIYLVEDDESIRKLVIYALESQGFELAGFESAEGFWKAMSEKKPDLAILDIMLPGEDGISVLKRIRKTQKRLPVIMLTAKVAEYDRVEGLDAGADDYISKPFGIMELIARVRAVLRRAEPAEAEDSEYKCGVLEIYWDRREVYADGKEASLTFKEFELLRMLVEHAGIVLPREKLLDSMNTTDNFIRPDYIIKWINDIHIDEHGSVCLLTMDRGMGKTSLSYALADKKISEMNDTFVAAYYCGSSQIQRDYILAINHALATGISERKTDSFVLLKRDALDRRQNMLESLEYFRKQHKLWDHKTKLMLIIDGLDELPQENQGLFDYIPAPENMPDNVYILLTSRNPVKEPLPEHVTKGLTEIRKKISDIMTVGADESSPNSYNNHTLLKEFVQKKVCLPSGKKPTEDEAESLIGLSGGIFLNLKLYAKLVESGMELHNLPALDSKELFSMYLGAALIL